MKARFFFTVLIALGFGLSSVAQDAATRKKQFNLDDEVAIGGYDPVAYILSNKAIKGKKDISVNHHGVIYYFSSTQNKDFFLKTPALYEPQYGGWCAYAMGAKGEKVSIDPKTFKVVNGKLYLFYHSYWDNTLKSWNKDESNLRSKADANWQRIFR